jgi:hypothetical protein
VIARWERTHHLIELGGLVAKAGLVELTYDDRAALCGILLAAAETHRGDQRTDAARRRRRRGLKAFNAKQQAQK